MEISCDIFLLISLLFFIDIVLCNNNVAEPHQTTPIPNQYDESFSNPGLPRSMFDPRLVHAYDTYSGFLNTNRGNHYYDDDDGYAHGTIISEPRFSGGSIPPGLSRSGLLTNHQRPLGAPLWPATHRGDYLSYNSVLHSEETLAVTDKKETCTVACAKNEFLCSRDCTCLPLKVRCNGFQDCIDGADEKDCKSIDCEKQGEVMCPRTSICISKNWLCDGDDDCGDFSDETGCGGRVVCPNDNFQCQNGLCVPKPWVCDGENDCRDFSDEVNCTQIPCNTEEFQCRDGSCVSLAFHCDGDPDCADLSDEFDCELPIPNCPEGEFKCRGMGGIGFGGKCILQRFRCDGDNDCGDWSDEDNCPIKFSSCSANEFKCDDGTCLPIRWKCDGEHDCDSGEDEKNCKDESGGLAKACETDEYMCKDERCILKSWLCDGTLDCNGGEDENNCEAKCELGQFACPLTKNSSKAILCVNKKYVCDGHFDCPNGEDEQKCPISKKCETPSKCEQLCVVHEGNVESCECRVGYVLQSNKRNCTDIDECSFSMNPVCSQKCVNTPGSFQCGCVPGYVLRPDLRTCKATGDAVKLIVAGRSDIRQVSLANHKYTSLVKGLQNAIAIDFHLKKNMIFWSDISIDAIKCMYLNGSGVRDIVKWGLESPGGIAVDWIHDLLFWTDSGTRRIEVSSLDGLYRTALIAKDLNKPRAIVVHPGESMLFWTDWGPSPKIERAYMDGSERIAIINDGIFWPNGLTFDYPANRIYWADAKHHVIESADLNGKNRKKVLSKHLPHPFALTIFEDNLYWTDWHTKSISTAHKVTGKGYHTILNSLHYPMDIHSVHSARQPDYKNSCKKDKRGLRGGCSHLCLPNRKSKQCSCPIGLSLRDSQTCNKSPNDILLITRKKDIRISQLSPTQNDIDMVLPLDGLKKTIALDWCGETNTIYWTDIGRSIICRASINGSNQETIINSNIIFPAGLAFDWVTNKLYWTDSGTNRIEVCTVDGKKRVLLIWQNMAKPRDIIVNSVEGIMFWSDWGPKPFIERAEMDGSNRQTIVNTGLQWPNGLAIDYSRKKLYFVDGGTKQLEYVNFDGSVRTKVEVKGLLHPFGLDIFDSKIYWTDWETLSVMSANKISGMDQQVIIANTTDLMDIRVFHRSRRHVTASPCTRNNGGCSHMCLLNKQGYSCACPIGVKLTNDNHTCYDGPFKYIIFAHRIDIRQISLDINYVVDIVLPLPAISNVMSVDVDSRTGDIYWSDTIEKVIMKSSLDGRDHRYVVADSLQNVDGIVLDLSGEKLYWTDSGRHTVEVSELDGSNRLVLIWEKLDSPRGIALDYNRGLLFWTDWGTPPKIEKSYLDGSGRVEIVSTNLGWPNGLAVDMDEERIYWTDAKSNRIETASYDGNFRRIILSELLHPYGIAVTFDMIYWTDWKTKSLNKVAKPLQSAKQAQLYPEVLRNNLEGLMDVKVVEKRRDIPSNICGNNNGGCSHICLRNNKSFTCKCPTGLNLINSTHCEVIPKDFLVFALRSGIGIISLSSPYIHDVVLSIPGVHGSVMVDYHYNKSQLFYADVNIDAIKMVNMYDVSRVENVITTGIDTPNGLAVDWIANNLYWSDTSLKTIEVSRLDGSCRKRIIQTDLNDPRSIILYPRRGYIYWADWGKPPRISRALMDGSDRKVIIDSQLGFPVGLTIDFESRRLYWADALEDRVESSGLDGSNRVTVVPHATHPFGATIYKEHIYWTDWYNKSIYRANKNSPKPNATEICSGLVGALDIRSVSQNRQPYDWNPCAQDNGGCSHICFFKRTSYGCGCPDIYDNRECSINPRFIVPFTPEPEEDDTVDIVKQLNNEIGGGNLDEFSGDYSMNVIYISSGVIGCLLIAVVALLLVLILLTKRKKDHRTPRESTRSILTFSNPNYNGADGNNQTEPKMTIWKKFKYDRTQDRSVEEKY